MRRQNLRCIMITFGRGSRRHKLTVSVCEWSRTQIWQSSLTKTWRWSWHWPQVRSRLMWSLDTTIKVPHVYRVRNGSLSITGARGTCPHSICGVEFTFSLALPACLMTSLEMLAVLVSAMMSVLAGSLAPVPVSLITGAAQQSDWDWDPVRLRRLRSETERGDRGRTARPGPGRAAQAGASPGRAQSREIGQKYYANFSNLLPLHPDTTGEFAYLGNMNNILNSDLISLFKYWNGWE